MRARSLLAALGLLAAACSLSAGVGPENTTTTEARPVPTAATTTPATAPAPTTTAPPPTTTLPPVPLTDVRIDVELIGADFSQPVFVTARPGDDLLYVVDQPGLVYAVDLALGTVREVLDITHLVAFGGERGLLGLTFHPDEPTRMIVHYSRRENGATVVAEYRLDQFGEVIPDSGVTILTQSQPASNHNGGMIEFGPDGYLYVALGDGGGANDQFRQGQDPFTLLGTILRLDLGEPGSYSIPPDNPFADGQEGAPEVWAYGLRNPWRFSFDGDDLWVGDVGQARWEEIHLFDVEVPGVNAGWSLVEGTHCFNVDPCEFGNLTAPIIDYEHESGRCSVTGGVVYRGALVPDLQGAYLYGDYCSGEIWALRPGDPVENALLTDPDDVYLPRLPGLATFGVGPEGEVYATQVSGEVWRIVAG